VQFKTFFYEKLDTKNVPTQARIKIRLRKSDMKKEPKTARHLAVKKSTWHLLPLGLACGVPQILRAENQADYRYEYYNEDANRMTIETHSVYFEQKLTDSFNARGEYVYDGISGATPTGGYAFAGSSPNSAVTKTIFTKLHDTRQAENFSLDWLAGNNTLPPGFAYSKETDYQSFGVSLNDDFAFNDKNTILQLGLSHNFDTVRLQPDSSRWAHKDSTDVIIGLSQILSPRDLLDVAVTYGYESGYLKDPYRNITFTKIGFSYPEVRPGYRSKEVLFTSLTHHFDSLDASLEGSYRLHHDSYGITDHTLGLIWHQKLGKHVILEPMFRFYEQSAASFYMLGVNGLFPSTMPSG